MLLKKILIFLCSISILAVSLGCTITTSRKYKKQRKTFKQYEENKTGTIHLDKYKGEVNYGKSDDWKPVTSELNFSDESYVKTSTDSYLELKMPYDNYIKLFSNTNLNLGTSLINLLDGELNTAISTEGKEKLLIRISKINIIGRSGVFKVIYNKESDKGEIVVKNGSVEVIEDNQEQKTVLLSGFYKVTFENDKLSNPTQAKVTDYNWR